MRYRGIAIAIIAASACVAAAQEKLLYSFGATATDGTNPAFSGVIADSHGNLYGVTNCGGAHEATNCGGTAFELIPTAGGGWKEKLLYSFGATSTDGSQPNSPLVFDAKGNLYGTTFGGGTNNSGGTVFELSPEANGAWTEKVLYSFGATSTDGVVPSNGPLIFDAQGNLYGVTAFGGDSPFFISGYGTAYELSPAGNGSWTEKVLYSFGATQTDGVKPTGLAFDAAGNLYGTTEYGGLYWSGTISGTVFELSPSASGQWTEKILYNFGPTPLKGNLPEAGLVFDAAGNLYGTTLRGGAYNESSLSFGDGTVFELSPAPNGTWTEKVVHSFGAGTDGFRPFSGLIIDAAGNLYGTTFDGGSHGGGGNALQDNGGTVFELSPITGGAWKETVLYNFGASAKDGFNPESALILDAEGNLYGTTMSGGAFYTGMAPYIGGTVFEIPATSAAVPRISPAPGTYLEAQMLSISDATPGATIYFTENGEAPTTASARYTGPIDIPESETVKAIAVAKGLSDSGIATATYVIETPAAPPVFSPAAGTFLAAQSVKLTDSTKGAAIYYTINGKIPTSASTLYTKPIAVASTTTIKAIAIAAGFLNSAVASDTYTITPPAPTPVFSLKAGTYDSAQTVKITDSATTGLAIYYTTNGMTPTASSTKYTSAGIKVATSETIKAIAIATSYSLSPVASATYTITPPAPTPTFTPKAGTYTSAQTVKIADTATTGLEIFYTTNGKTPTASSLKYTSAGIVVSSSQTIQAIAIATGYSQSPVASAAYTIHLGSPATGVYVVQAAPTFGTSSGQILRFAATSHGSVAPLSVITAPANTAFANLDTDGKGNIYVNGQSPTSLDLRAYAPGSTGSPTPTRLIPSNNTTMMWAPDGIAVTAAGEVVVGEDTGGIATYSPAANGSVAPERYILGISQTGGGKSGVEVADQVAVDPTGIVYVLAEGNLAGNNGLFVFSPTETGNVPPVRMISGPLTTLGAIGGLATDSLGNLYVSSTGNPFAKTASSILVFAPGASGNVAPVRTISGSATLLGTLWGIKVDAAGNIFVISSGPSNGENPTVLKFAAGASGNAGPVSSFTSTIWTRMDNGGSLAVY